MAYSLPVLLFSDKTTCCSVTFPASTGSFVCPRALPLGHYSLKANGVR